MSLQVHVVDRISDIRAADFDTLDASAGVSSCYARTRQRESDGRWRLRYLRCIDEESEESLKAVIPLYTSRAKAWPDPSYDPATWPTPETGSQDPMTPRTSLLVGGCTYLQSSLHARPDFRDSGRFRHALAEIASLAAEEGRGLVFPYHYTAAKDALTRASDGQIAWSLLENEAVLRNVSSPTWEADLGSRPRYSLRTDAKQIAAAGLTSTVRTWDEAEESVCELIAEHNGEKGRADHPEFVRMRYREWARCDGVGILVFTSESRTVYGAVTALIWNGDLEMQEVGLAGPPGSDRHAAYLDLVFRQPIEYARAHGLRDIRLGPMALQPKASRGAFFRELYGGTLGVTETKALAQAAAWPNEPEVRE